MTTSLLVNYANEGAGTGSVRDRSVLLEQIVPNKVEKFASLIDLYKAWMLSASGLSAQRYRIAECPIEFDGTLVRFFLGFYAYPSSFDFDYDLEVNGLGSISEGIRVNIDKQIHLFADNQKEIALDYNMKNISTDWKTPVYNPYGQVISAPSFTQIDKSLIFDKSVFGELEIGGKAQGYYYILTVEIDKEYWVPEEEEAAPETGVSDDVIIVTEFGPDEMNANSINNLEISITASWKDIEGKVQTDILDLEIPECVKKVLQFCPGEEVMFYLQWCEEVSDRQVYYSTCTGEVMEVWDGLNPRDYCTKIAMDKDPGPWLRRLIND